RRRGEDDRGSSRARSTSPDVTRGRAVSIGRGRATTGVPPRPELASPRRRWRDRHPAPSLRRPNACGNLRGSRSSSSCRRHWVPRGSPPRPYAPRSRHPGERRPAHSACGGRGPVSLPRSFSPRSKSPTDRSISTTWRARSYTEAKGLASGVEGFDLVPVAVRHHVPLHLQGGSQLLTLDGEVVRQDPELADRLGLRDGPVGTIDRFLHRLQ